MKYFAYLDGQVVGPNELTELSSRPGFGPTTLVCPEGRAGDVAGDWAKAATLQVAAGLFPASAVAQTSLAARAAGGEPSMTVGTLPKTTEGDLKRAEEKIAGLEASLRRLQEDVADRERRAEALEAEAKSKGAELAQLRAQLAELDAKLGELPKLREELDQARGDLKLTQTQLEDAREKAKVAPPPPAPPAPVAAALPPMPAIQAPPPPKPEMLIKPAAASEPLPLVSDLLKEAPAPEKRLDIPKLEPKLEPKIELEPRIELKLEPKVEIAKKLDVPAVAPKVEIAKKPELPAIEKKDEPKPEAVKKPEFESTIRVDPEPPAADPGVIVLQDVVDQPSAPPPPEKEVSKGTELESALEAAMGGGAAAPVADAKETVRAAAAAAKAAPAAAKAPPKVEYLAGKPRSKKGKWIALAIVLVGGGTFFVLHQQGGSPGTEPPATAPAADGSAPAMPGAPEAGDGKEQARGFLENYPLPHLGVTVGEKLAPLASGADARKARLSPWMVQQQGEARYLIEFYTSQVDPETDSDLVYKFAVDLEVETVEGLNGPAKALLEPGAPSPADAAPAIPVEEKPKPSAPAPKKAAAPAPKAKAAPAAPAADPFAGEALGDSVLDEAGDPTAGPPIEDEAPQAKPKGKAKTKEPEFLLPGIPNPER